MAIYYITGFTQTVDARGRPRWMTNLEQFPVPQAAIIPMNSATPPAPLFTWALVYIATGTDVSAIDAAIAAGTVSADKLPITTLDQTIGSLTPQQRQTFQTIGARYGVTAISGLKNSDTCRDALIMFGQTLDKTFNPDTFAAGT